MSNHQESQLSALLPSVVLLGTFALILALLMPSMTPTGYVSLDPDAEVVAVAPTESGEVVAGFDAARGFAWSCSGCHGAAGDGEGVPYGVSIVDSALLQDADGFIAFMTDAYPPTDPEVKYPHPYRGGYPELSDEELSQLLDYLTSEFAN